MNMVLCTEEYKSVWRGKVAEINPVIRTRAERLLLRQMKHSTAVPFYRSCLPKQVMHAEVNEGWYIAARCTQRKEIGSCIQKKCDESNVAWSISII